MNQEHSVKFFNNKNVLLVALFCVIILLSIYSAFTLSQRILQPDQIPILTDHESNNLLTIPVSPCPPPDQYGYVQIKSVFPNAVSTVNVSQCSFSIEKDKNDGTVFIRTTSSGVNQIDISRNGKVVSSLTCGDRFSDDEVAYDCGEDDVVYFQDITNDGYIDMMIKTMCGAYQCVFDYYIYDVETNTYRKSDVLTNLVEPYFDSNNNTITTYAKGRGIGDIFTKDKYILQSGATYRLVESCSQEVLDYRSSYSDYEYICLIWDGSKMSTSSVKRIPYSEIFAD
jgi:hypothetical protein